MKNIKRKKTNSAEKFLGKNPNSTAHLKIPRSPENCGP